MNKRVMLAAIVALAMLLAVTPVLAAGSGYQYQDLEQNQNETNNYEYNKGTAENQEQNLEQIQDQEQNAHQQPIPAGEQAAQLRGEVDRKGGSGTFRVSGTIEALDDELLTITINVSKPLSYDDDIVVQTTPDTFFSECEGEQIGFDDLEVGDYVRISGTTDGESYTAVRVIVQVPPES